MAEQLEPLNSQGGENLTQDEEREELIQAVKLHKNLYDPSSNSNRNKYLREMDWKSVATGLLNKEEQWCRAEWRKLTDNYKKKKAIIGKTGQARKRIEAWPHFASMQFLDDFQVTAETSGNLNAYSDDETSNLGIESDDLERAVINPTPGTVPKATPKTRGDITYSCKRNRSRDADPVDQEIVNFLKLPKEVEDGHHHFGMSVAEDMRKLDPQMASYVKMRITQVMYEAMHPTQPGFNNAN